MIVFGFYIFLFKGMFVVHFYGGVSANLQGIVFFFFLRLGRLGFPLLAPGGVFFFFFFFSGLNGCYSYL